MASDGDEVENFEITDYDLESELNPGFRKKQTKEQAIYGVWADSDDEDESRYRKKTRKKMKDDYTAPLGFVSAGVFHDDDESGASGAETPGAISYVLRNRLQTIAYFKTFFLTMFNLHVIKLSE